MPARTIRSLAWLRQQCAFLVVLAGLVVGFLYLLLEPGHWRRGTAALAAVILVAAVLRAALPTAWVGLLAVRSRWLDALCLLLLGGVILAVDIRLHT